MTDHDAVKGPGPKDVRTRETRSGQCRFGGFFLLAVLLLAVGTRWAVLEEPGTCLRISRPVVDAAWHDWWARSLASDSWSPPSGQPDPEIASHAFFKPPGYPVFLAAVHALSGNRPQAAQMVQHALGVLTLLLVFVVGRLLFGGLAGWWSLMLLAGSPIPILYETELLEPALLAFLVILLVWVSLEAVARRSRLLALGTGMVLGSLCAVRANGLVWVPLVVWLFLRGGETPQGVSGSQPLEGGDPPLQGDSLSQSLSGGPAGRPRPARCGKWALAAADGGAKRKFGAVQATLLLLFGFLLVLGPITARNWLVERELVLISANGGLNLFLGNHPTADGASPTGPGFQRWSSFEYPQRLRRLWPGESISFAEASRRLTRQALDWAWEHPSQALALSWRKFLLLIGPREIENAGNRVEAFEIGQSPMLSRLPVGFSGLLALALARLFAVRWGRIAVEGEHEGRAVARGGGAMFIAGMAALWLLSFVPFFAAARFRAPILPLLAVLAGGGFDRLLAVLGIWGKPAPVAELRGLVIGLMLGVFAAVPNWSGFEPGVAEGWFQRGLDHASGGKTEQAMAAYRTVLALNPGHSWAANNLGSLLLQAGDEDGALKHFRVAAGGGENCPEGLYNLGVLAGRKNSWKEAVSALSEFTRMKPERADGWYNLALVATGLEDLRAAEEAYRRAIALQPGDGQTRNNFAVVLLLQGKHAEAWKEIQACRASGYEPDAGLIEAIRSKLGN